jgi:hypothetical protein
MIISRCKISVAARWASTAAASGHRVKPYEQIPGPKPLPLVGNAWRFIPKIGARIDI